MKDLIQRDGERLYTTSEIIAELLEVDHESTYKLIKKHLEHFSDFGKVGFQIRPSDNGQKILYAVLNEDQAYFLLTLSRNKESVIAAKKELIKAFRKARSEIDRLRRQQDSIDWKRLRRDTKEAFKFVNAALDQVRSLEGKMTKPHHYMNEARMMNCVLTGEFKGIDRDSLSESQLNLLSRIETANHNMIIQGKTYQERKQTLLDMFIPKLQ